MDLSSYDFAECREFHAWERGGFDRRPGRAGVARILKCANCGTERHDIYNVRGAVMEQRYKYPAGYKIPGSGLKKADFRRELMERAGVVSSRGRKHLRAV